MVHNWVSVLLLVDGRGGGGDGIALALQVPHAVTSQQGVPWQSAGLRVRGACARWRLGS